MSAIFDAASKLRTKELKIEYLREFLTNKEMNNIYFALMRDIIQGAYHPGVVWLLPKGNLPYRPLMENSDTEYVLYRESKRGKLSLFCKGGVDNLPQARRETLFIQLLESIPPDEAKLLIAVKDKYLPYEGLTYEFFNEVFPGILPEREVSKPFPVVPATKVVEEMRFSGTDTPNNPPKETKAFASGKKVFNDGFKNYLIPEEEGISRGLVRGRV
jgi:hypothetical protein